MRPGSFVLVTGASGSGTTTLAAALAAHLGWRHLDLDDYYWLPSSPPYRHKREAGERLEMCLRDLHASPCAVVSGSMVNWGPALEDAFDLIVFLYLPAQVRIERLRSRELQRFGAADPAFLQWAAEYDAGPAEGRSLAKHRAWLAQRSCPVLRIEEDLSVPARLQRVLNAMRGVA